MNPVCRACAADLRDTFVDLGMSPLSNAFLSAARLRQMEPFFPLHAYVCERCYLVQLEEFEKPQALFSDYAYFSSYSSSWLAHAKSYVQHMVERFGINAEQFVVEIASNDGYLLQYWQERQIPMLGVEPAANVAETARQKGIPTETCFFGAATAAQLAARYRLADLITGNNVLAHVPDLNDFVVGLRRLVKPAGIITLEFPHLLRLMLGNQFDTIYHEHFSYFSLLVLMPVFARHDLRVFDVQRLVTHGGSLRVFLTPASGSGPETLPGVAGLLREETDARLDHLDTYLAFAEKVRRVKRELLQFLIEAKNAGKTIVAYGAAAKGNTLLNYCGIGTDFIEYVVDQSPHKQGLFLPGTHIPIRAPEEIKKTRPDYILLLPWNLKDEIDQQLEYRRQWNGKLVIPIPGVQVLP